MQYRSQSLKHDFELSRRQLIEKGFGGLHACCVGKKNNSLRVNFL